MRIKKLCAALLSAALLAVPAAALETDPENEITQEPSVAAVTSMKGLRAELSTSLVAIDGLYVWPEGYAINGYNYYKLRDIAYLMIGKKSAFDVKWDESFGCVSLSTERNYLVEGGEMKVSGSTEITKLVPTYSEVRVNGSLVELNGYNINNNNYYRIRDIAPMTGFDVEWDALNSTVAIDSKTFSLPPDHGDEQPAESSGELLFGPEEQVEEQTPQTGEEQPAEEGSAEQPDNTASNPEGEGEEAEPVYPWLGTKIDDVLTILIDPGHGGADAGSRNASTGQNEKVTNLAVAKYLREMLVADGVRVLMTRENVEDYLYGADRKAAVREYCETGELDLVISIHHNAANKTANGSEVWVQRTGLAPDALLDDNIDPCHTSQELGALILKSFMNLGIGLNNRGVRLSEGKYMVNIPGDYGIPSILTEFCFLDNAHDIRLIDEPAEQQAEARAIYRAIKAFYTENPY